MLPHILYKTAQCIQTDQRCMVSPFVMEELHEWLPRIHSCPALLRGNEVYPTSQFWGIKRYTSKTHTRPHLHTHTTHLHPHTQNGLEIIQNASKQTVYWKISLHTLHENFQCFLQSISIANLCLNICPHGYTGGKERGGVGGVGRVRELGNECTRSEEKWGGRR